MPKGTHTSLSQWTGSGFSRPMQQNDFKTFFTRSKTVGKKGIEAENG
jgi:hypothetical protein